MVLVVVEAKRACCMSPAGVDVRISTDEKCGFGASALRLPERHRYFFRELKFGYTAEAGSTQQVVINLGR